MDNMRYQYEKLLFERDKVKKQAEEYLRMYIFEFGELITELFRKKISCIEKKKMIAFCQASVNHNQNIDINAMNCYIENEMSDYNQRLQDMIDSNKACKEIEPINQNEALMVKRLYRQIAKKIHPDLHPEIDNPVLSDLWENVMNAYHCNDLQALEELEVQINSVLKYSGFNVQERDIPDIEEKIHSLETEIENIMSTDPYQYKFILDDENKIREIKDDLNREIEEYTIYEKQLQDILKSFIERGAKFTWEN